MRDHKRISWESDEIDARSLLNDIPVYRGMQGTHVVRYSNKGKYHVIVESYIGVLVGPPLPA